LVAFLKKGFHKVSMFENSGGNAAGYIRRPMESTRSFSPPPTQHNTEQKLSAYLNDKAACKNLLFWLTKHPSLNPAAAKSFDIPYSTWTRAGSTPSGTGSIDRTETKPLQGLARVASAERVVRVADQESSYCYPSLVLRFQKSFLIPSHSVYAKLIDPVERSIDQLAAGQDAEVSSEGPVDWLA
jgi:hypothetical protein